MDSGSELVPVRETTARFYRWLVADSLPLWSTTGVDRQSGGFIEQLTPQGEIIADVRRARLVARQIFAFRSAGQLGWNGPVDELVDHGLSALLDNHLTPDGKVVPRYIPASGRGEGEFDLYDQAFVLFGLANGFAHTGDPKLESLGLSIVSRMRDEFSQDGGFAEHRPAKAPLKANPHMHMLEAALAWSEASGNRVWTSLATDIVELCLSRFIDPETGSLHEYFDTDWSVLEGPADIVEPGHQAEWAWLLLRSHRSNPSSRLIDVAERLLAIAEDEGLNRSQQRLINELNPDLSPRDTRLRLWPQTERIKALIMFYERETAPDRRRILAGKIASAVDALLGHFEHPIRGAWWEHFDEAGSPINEPARASSLYHILGAANELAGLTELGLASSTLSEADICSELL